MRKSKILHRDGDLRHISRFLWFPRTIRSDIFRTTETRWLERAIIRQEYSCHEGRWIDLMFTKCNWETSWKKKL